MALIKCKDCGQEVSTDTNLCPNCGGKIQRKNRTFRSFVLFILILIFIGHLINNITDNNKVVKLEAVENIPELHVSAETLMSDYQSNEVAADGKYRNKVIKVDGVIASIGNDILGTPYVTLKTNDNLFSVQCMFDHSFEGKLANLRKNQELSVLGRVSGKLGNIILKECSF